MWNLQKSACDCVQILGKMALNNTDLWWLTASVFGKRKNSYAYLVLKCKKFIRILVSLIRLGHIKGGGKNFNVLGL